MTRRIDADVAVIGGGVIGLASAYELLVRGRRVVVLERERPGSGAAAVAAGMLSPVSEVETESPAFVDLALESCGMYPSWIAGIEAASGLGCGYREEGSLLLALHRDHEVELERLMNTQRRLGLQSEPVGRDQVLQMEPYVSPRVTGGLFVPGDHQVNPRRLSQALAAAIRALGGEIVEGHAGAPVIEGGIVAGASTPGVEVRAETVLIAGGAWSPEVWPAAAGPLPMRPVKGQILRLRGPRIIDHVLRTPDVYLVPREDGELVVGATMEEQGFDTSIQVWAVMDLLRDAWRILPGISELELAETSAGLRPALRDHLPAIGATAVQGLFVATGHFRHGVLLAPVTAKLLSDAIDGARVPAAFDPKRLLVAPANTGAA